MTLAVNSESCDLICGPLLFHFMGNDTKITQTNSYPEIVSWKKRTAHKPVWLNGKFIQVSLDGDFVQPQQFCLSYLGFGHLGFIDCRLVDVASIECQLNQPVLYNFPRCGG